METKLFHWLGREFVEIRAEGRAGVAADTATEELFRKFDDELQLSGLSLRQLLCVSAYGDEIKMRVPSLQRHGLKSLREQERWQAPVLFRSNGSIRMQWQGWSCWR